MTDSRIDIFTDGACRGNPGAGGWAACLRHGDRERLVAGATPHTTNNRMELMAAIEGLATLNGSRRVRVTTDSEYVRRGITEWLARWKANGWKTAARAPVKNRDLWERLEGLARRHDVEWVWVKGHSGHVDNERVDRAANAAIDEMLAADGPEPR